MSLQMMPCLRSQDHNTSHRRSLDHPTHGWLLLLQHMLPRASLLRRLRLRRQPLRHETHEMAMPPVHQRANLA